MDSQWWTEGGRNRLAQQRSGRYVRSFDSLVLCRSSSSSFEDGQPIKLLSLPWFSGARVEAPFPIFVHESSNPANVQSLINKYFDVVDPVYPMINREAFLGDYESFWSRLPVFYAGLGDHPRENADLVYVVSTLQFSFSLLFGRPAICSRTDVV